VRVYMMYKITVYRKGGYSKVHVTTGKARVRFDYFSKSRDTAKGSGADVIALIQRRRRAGLHSSRLSMVSECMGLPREHSAQPSVST